MISKCRAWAETHSCKDLGSNAKNRLIYGGKVTAEIWKVNKESTKSSDYGRNGSGTLLNVVPEPKILKIGPQGPKVEHFWLRRNTYAWPKNENCSNFGPRGWIFKIFVSNPPLFGVPDRFPAKLEPLDDSLHHFLSFGQFSEKWKCFSHFLVDKIFQTPNSWIYFSLVSGLSEK